MSVRRVMSVAAVAFFAFLLAGQLYTRYLDGPATGEQRLVQYLIFLARDISMWLASGLFVASTLAAVRLKRTNHVRAWAMLAASLAIPVLGAGMLGFAYIQLSDARAAVSESVEATDRLLEIHESILVSTKMSLEDRSQGAAMTASNIFISTGRVAEVIDADGKRHPYSPSPQDVSLREDIVYAIALVDQTRHSMQRGILVWLAVVVLALICGLRMGPTR